ncbi:hypothetical protein O0S10_06740 [Methanocorpusculum sp. MG]|uniref:Uncharacterized protein n=1 Tax=Methanocorpusculum petauri TaxID=3002863 RepID=A0ABT4II42_9EURY|nr:hypothetical protein [Methanocorpusculum petauri]MCZ0860922.1 hypothetical protein [Methanocorpusculum petauri]
MTYTPFDPEPFLTITLPRIHPRPSDPYEAALHSRDLAYIFEEFHLNFIEQYHKDLELITGENCESDEYQLIRRTRTTCKVNIPKLRTDHPDLHQQLVYLRATDAEKFLGRRYLYTAARDHAGDRITRYEQINIDDLRKHLTPAELPHYLTTTERPLTPEIITLRNTP